MCNFLSAIVLRDGEILTAPEHTDSHQELIDFYGLKDDEKERFARVEFKPSSEEAYDKPDAYILTIDQEITPHWFDEAMAERVRAKLRARVQMMVVRSDRKILLGGAWILTGKASVSDVKNARIISMHESSRVDSMYGESRVESMHDSSRVGYMHGKSRVG